MKTKKRKLTGTWNAERVLHEYLYFSDKRGRIKYGVNWADESPDGIRLRRFAAAMKAYGKDMDDFVEGEGLVGDACSPDKTDELRRLLKDNLTNDYLMNQVDKSEFDRSDRCALFRTLLRYRLTLYDAENVWSGVVECSPTIALAIHASKSLYQNHIKPVSEVVDRMLMLLMGDDYDKSFAEEELLPYGYPDVTDEELEDRILENF